MADAELKPASRKMKKDKKKKKRLLDDTIEKHGDEEQQRPRKVSRANHRKSDSNKEEAENKLEHSGGVDKIEEEGPPWGNLQLILTLQSKDIDIQKKMELAFDYVKLKGGMKMDDNSLRQETVSMSRVIVFLNNWVQSFLISLEKKRRIDESKNHPQVTGSCLDHRCWEILKFCSEESLKVGVLLSFSKDFLRVIHCIVSEVLHQLNSAPLHSKELVFSEQFALYSTLLTCISSVFSSHGGVLNESLDLWVLTIGLVLKLLQRVFEDKLDNGKMGNFVLHLLYLMLEPFTKFLRVHPTRKNGYHDFVDKLLEPLLYLLDILDSHADGNGHGLTGNLLKSIDDVISQGLFHPVHIDGFLSLQIIGKLKTSSDGMQNDSRVVNKSYHRHLFDKLEKIITRKTLALGGLANVFRLFVDCVKTQKGASLTAVSGNLKYNSYDLTPGASSTNCAVVSIDSQCSNGVSAETRKSLFDFFVQMMEPLLLEIGTYVQGELEIGPTLLDVPCILNATNKLLFSLLRKNVYTRTEDNKGACLKFLKAVYSTIMSFSAKLNQLHLSSFGLDEGSNGEMLNLIAKELVVSVQYLLDIEYEVVGGDLESLWSMMFSLLAFGHSLQDAPDQSVLTSEILHLGCQLMNLYSELRQVNSSLFALCKAARHLAVSVRDADKKKSRFVTASPPLYYQSSTYSFGMLLCSAEFKLSTCNAIKSIPEGQASGCIRCLTEDISETLKYMDAANDLGQVDLSNSCLPCHNLQAEVLGRGLSEVYTLILDSVSVTTGNSYLVGVALNELMAVLRCNMSILVAVRPNNIEEFLSAVTGRTIDNLPECRDSYISFHWVFLFFFRLYMSLRCVFWQTISLVPPDTSRKMLGAMGDSFTVFSGKDWLEKTSKIDEGYFASIVQPSASLLTIIQAVSDIYHHDGAADCCSLTLVFIAMALQRLVDINRLIKSFEYLGRRKNHLVGTKVEDGFLKVGKISRKSERCVLDFRKEAADLTNFIMGHLPLVAEGHLSFCSSDDATYSDKSAKVIHDSHVWDFVVGAVNKSTLPTAMWWIICQNVDIWCVHASKKKLKNFLSILIYNSLLCGDSSLDDFGNHCTNEPGLTKKVTKHQISWELLSDTVLHEQTFVRRYMASRFCKILEEAVLSVFSEFKQGHLNEGPDWPEFLSSLENASTVNVNAGTSLISVVSTKLPDDCCRGQEFLPFESKKFITLQKLLTFLCWMPKGNQNSKSLILYTSCIINLERLVVGRLLDCHGVLHSRTHCELLRLFVSCRRAIKNLVITSSEEKVEDSPSSLLCMLCEGSSPILWLLKSLSAVNGLHHVFAGDLANQARELMFLLMDHTSYVFSILSKYQFLHAINSFVFGEKQSNEEPSSPMTKIHIGSEICVDSSECINAWGSVVILAETLRGQAEHLLTFLKEITLEEKVKVFAGVENLRRYSSTISFFQGFLWGLASALDHVDAKGCEFGSRLSASKFEPILKLNLCIGSLADFVSCFLLMLLLEGGQLPQSLSDAQTLPLLAPSDDCLGVVEKSLNQGSCWSGVAPYAKELQKPGTTTDCTESFGIKHEPSKAAQKKRSHSENTDLNSILNQVDLFEQQFLKKSTLKGFLSGETPEDTFLLRQLYMAMAAILRLNLHINNISLSSILVPAFVCVSQGLLLEFASMTEVMPPFSFVCLDGIVKFLQELGARFPLSDSALSRNAFVKLIDLHLRAIGKCISLQGKRATLASHEMESSIKIIHDQMRFSQSTLSHVPNCLDELKARLRMSFEVLIKKTSELHLLSAIQGIERALVGVQEGCMTNYEICTGSSGGGKVSSIVAAGIDCLDMVLEFVKGRKRLNVIRRHIQSLVACLFNIVVHLKGPKVFHVAVLNSTGADPDAGSVILMCVDILARVAGKHALFPLDAYHVGQSLHIPAVLFRHFLQHGTCEIPAQFTSVRFLDNQDGDSADIGGPCAVDPRFTIELYGACCRLLCSVLKHHKSDSQQCFALLEDSVSTLLHCLEAVQIGQFGKNANSALDIQEGVKCACFLRRVYEEIRQQKDVFGRHCFQLLSNYIWTYCGNGPRKNGIRREIDAALRPGIYALIDACLADDLQHLHTAFGEGPCRSTLATLQHDYKLNFQYEGKV